MKESVFTNRVRLGMGVLFLTTQLVAIGYARFVPARYFCWAPYDTITLFTLTATENGHVLTNDELRSRYQYRSTGRDNRSPQHIIDRIAQYERTYGRNDSTRIVLRYSVNGTEEKVWQWPIQP